MPYKDAVIERLKMPANQVSLVKLDLHYSHKTPAVLKLFKKHKIAVVFVPARCTDVLEECDTVVNKPFMSGLKAAFRDFIHHDFNCYKGDKKEWAIKLTVGKLKRHIASFVETGINAIRSEEFSSVIRHAFKTHGMFEEIRGPVRQLMAATDAQSLDHVPVEDEVNEKVFVMGEDDEEGEMVKVLYDGDESDDHSDDESDNGKDKGVKYRKEKESNKTVSKGTPLFLAPSVLSTPKTIPLSTSGDTNNKRSIASTKKANTLSKTPQKSIPMSTSSISKAYAMLDTPSPKINEQSVVTPHVPETTSAVGPNLPSRSNSFRCDTRI